MTALRQRSTRLRGDDGVALIITMMVFLVIAALTTTVAAVAVNNTQNTVRDRQAGSALNVSEAGIAEAVEYLRSNGAGPLQCAPGCGLNGTPYVDWGSQANPHVVRVDSGQTYAVHFAKLASTGVESFRVFSEGLAGAGPGARRISVDLEYAPFKSYPIGIFTSNYDAGGTGHITNMSVFSDGCVTRRDNLKTAGIDPYYGIPAAVHSSKYITKKNTGGTCGPNEDGNVHRPGSIGFCNSQPATGNNADLRGDQDAEGGVLDPANPAHTACYKYGATAYPSGGTKAAEYLTDSNMTTTTLAEKYDYREGGLTAIELEQLRAVAKRQGNYHTTANYTPPNGLITPQAVVFFDLKGSEAGKTVDLSLPVNYNRPAGLSFGDPACHNRQVIMVVLNGNGKMVSNATYVTQLFVPSAGPTNGNLLLGGGANIIGTLYATRINQQGTSNFQLDDCFLKNLSGAQFTITQKNYRELDRP